MSTDEALGALREAFAESLEAGHRWWRRAEAQADSATLARWAAAALTAMGPDDGISWGMRACDVLRRHGGASEIEPLRAARPGLPARKALRDWRLEADRALAVIEARAAGRCTCEAEARHGAPVAGPRWQVEGEAVDRAAYAIIHEVRCVPCGRRYRVERQEGYHYPVFRWAKL